jgi:hypothetical protein
MNNFCDNMFSSLKTTIDTLKKDVSIQEIAKAFIQTIQSVYSQYTKNSNMCGLVKETSNDLSLLVQANNIALIMIKNLSSINSKYFQMIYHCLGQSNIDELKNRDFLKNIKQKHFAEIGELIDQSYANFQILIKLFSESELKKKLRAQKQRAQK